MLFYLIIEKERYLDKYEKDKKKSLEEEISKVKEAREVLIKYFYYLIIILLINNY